MSFGEVIISICCIVLMICVGISLKNTVERQDYIENLEIKINELTEEYYR